MLNPYFASTSTYKAMAFPKVFIVSKKLTDVIGLLFLVQ
jgi:hypothetical protein